MSLKFLVVERVPFQVIVGSLSLEITQEIEYFGAQEAYMNAHGRNSVLPLEDDHRKQRIETRSTDREYFKLVFNAVEDCFLEGGDSE